jgi:hypothetical protein
MGQRRGAVFLLWRGPDQQAFVVPNYDRVARRVERARGVPSCVNASVLLRLSGLMRDWAVEDQATGISC